jgi:hypoxanthine phosphoribosyltransferase
MSQLNKESKDKIVVNNDIFVPMLSELDIKNRVKELAEQISNDYKGKLPIFIGVLNGAFVFMADLIKNLTIDCEIDFFKLSSYGDSKISSGNVRMLKELNCDVNGRDVIIVEDIVDSGLSIKYIEEIFSQYSPKSMKVCSLLMKPDSLKYNVKIDYIGFKIPTKFVIGYGLDYAQKFRNLKTIYVLSDES